MVTASSSAVSALPSWRSIGTATPRHDCASELDSWDCVDELMAEEDYRQEWGEAVAR